MGATAISYTAKFAKTPSTISGRTHRVVTTVCPSANTSVYLRRSVHAAPPASRVVTHTSSLAQHPTLLTRMGYKRRTITNGPRRSRRLQGPTTWALDRSSAGRRLAIQSQESQPQPKKRGRAYVDDHQCRIRLGDAVLCA